MRFIATCKMGLESVVASELEALDIHVERKEDARVMFTGGFFEMAKACLWLRAAERVLFVVAQFKAVSFEELFDNVMRLELKQYFTKTSVIHVNGKTAKSTLFSVTDCQSIVKKAIVENLKKAFKTQTLTESTNKVMVEVGILRDEVTFALDACGSGLSRRGYRLTNFEAPIAESLAAGILLLTRYRGGIPLIDPFCGSGTIPIEAAMIARNQAPGLNRAFAAEQWHFLSADLFDTIRNDARDAIKNVTLKIMGMDIDERCVKMSKQHAKKAGVMVDWKVQPFSEFELPYEGEKGTIICNPPYGERMSERRSVEILYRQMSEVFGALPVGWSRNIITAYPDFENVYGKRADKRRNLSNGGKRCTFYSYFK